MQGKEYYRFKAQSFLHEYDLSCLTLEKLMTIIESQGYKIIRYNTFEEVVSTETLLNELDLKQYSLMNAAFTYRDGSVKIVFLDDTLLEHDKLYALAHEEGHIYCGHMDRYTCSSTGVDDEHEANEFAHYVMNPPTIYKWGFFFKSHFKQIIIAFCIMALLIATPYVIRCIQTAKLNAAKDYVKTLEYYVTESGNKYHVKNCKYVKDKEHIRKITEEEFQSGLFAPCKDCIKE